MDDLFMVPDDPMGKDGPTLDEYLTNAWIATHTRTRTNTTHIHTAADHYDPTERQQQPMPIHLFSYPSFFFNKSIFFFFFF